MSMSDLSGLEKMIKDMQTLVDETPKMLEDFLLEMAQKVWDRTKHRTPIGVYDKQVSFTTKDGKEVSFKPHTGKKGGTLKKGWMLGGVKRVGDFLEIEIYNDEEYALYVEEGHRIMRNGKQIGFAEGYRMCEISIHEIEKQMPLRLEKAWQQFCAAKLGGG